MGGPLVAVTTRRCARYLPAAVAYFQWFRGTARRGRVEQDGFTGITEQGLPRASVPVAGSIETDCGTHTKDVVTAIPERNFATGTMAAFCAAFVVGVRHGRRKLHAVPLLTVVRITGAMQLRPSEVCAQRRYIALLGRHDCAVAGIAVLCAARAPLSVACCGGGCASLSTNTRRPSRG
ncbi:hypothetical protein TcYC6_0035590 [Trypanosoma cruzi]|nr:hypothetical protein TcYC6_0015260 [Trypanosoma cruzi]KAF8290482.1 hypothetical protein TcYC6_0035590 [Trypanosoma cruzi]